VLASFTVPQRHLDLLACGLVLLLLFLCGHA
jgi:hypothetical protein